MTAKVTLSFSDQTIADARHWAERDGVSLSAWIDRAAQERALREIFTAHAEAVRRAKPDLERAARSIQALSETPSRSAQCRASAMV